MYIIFSLFWCRCQTNYARMFVSRHSRNPIFSWLKMEMLYVEFMFQYIIHIYLYPLDERSSIAFDCWAIWISIFIFNSSVGQKRNCSESSTNDFCNIIKTSINSPNVDMNETIQDRQVVTGTYYLLLLGNSGDLSINIWSMFLLYLPLDWLLWVAQMFAVTEIIHQWYTAAWNIR